MKNSKKVAMIVGIGIVIGIIFYFIVGSLLQPQLNQSISNLSSNSFRSLFASEDAKVVEEAIVHRDPPRLNLKSEHSILIEDLKTTGINIAVEQYDEETGLMEEVATETQTYVEPDIIGNLPWFYFSPYVEVTSPYSTAQQYRLVEDESLNGFKRVIYQGEELLFQNELPYTGWYNTPFDGWYYYSDGRMQANVRLSSTDVGELLAERDLLNFLVPAVRKEFFFVEDTMKYSGLMERTPTNYSILFKNPDSMVLTNPPGAIDSALLTTTENFVDMPMEVLEEVKTFNGDWLLVAIGYDEVGWIQKDETFTDYVYTYYSERELIDTIEAVLIEELDQIGARAGASFVNTETMSQVSAYDQPFFPASTQKIYVLGELYRQYSEGILDPYDTVVLYDYDKVPGAGIIQGYPDGSVFTIDELVNLIVVYSDNTAANLLIDTVGGGPAINPNIHALGLYNTYVDGKYYQDSSGFVTTPSDAARFFALLYNNQVNGEPWDELLIEKFGYNTHNFLTNYIPYSTVYWNKSGLGGTEQNDVASFVTDYGSYTLAVYTADPYNYDIIGEQLGMLSLRVHDVYNEIRSQLWVTVEDTETFEENSY
ncbi:serine hydrolase [Fundicoccus culcitae]|uniref:Class A beta-lactamase-related serine hydrolase n=1 Tax=Fundicoccus culcitae TaxID=2969821 RepID=A0ABY5P9B1_9LACT|nr:serine hydrolase [Fundicoccus culcitae]UUX35333.1 class A beta-lactamase-related serine hydrolase [Fundicoccus culcitae]